MSAKNMIRPDPTKLVPMTASKVKVSDLLQGYGSSSIPFAGADNALYERHLIFDRAIDPKVASARERFEAFSHSVRDILAQRWVLTKSTHERENAKRIYYLSMEFLIGRSLANNVSNLLLDPVVQAACQEKGIDWFELIEQEPDAGLGNGGLGRLAACFLDSMATMQLAATGYGLRYEYGMFKQSIVNGWQKESADNWLRDNDPWEIARSHEKVKIKLNCSFVLGGGNFKVIPERPSTLIGIPFDRPVVGYAGRTINTLRLWAAAAPDYFDFEKFGTGDFVGALGETLEAESLTRVLYPDDSTTEGQGLRSCRNISWSHAPWRIWCAVSSVTTRIGTNCRRRSPFNSTTVREEAPDDCADLTVGTVGSMQNDRVCAEAIDRYFREAVVLLY